MAIPAIVGGGLAFAGGMASLFGGDNGAQLDPAIQAALAQEGIDVQKFMANYQAAAAGLEMPYSQDVQKYSAQLQQSLGAQYTKAYGSIESAAQEMAKAAFAGKASPATQQLLNTQASTAGQQRAAGANALKANLAAAGQDLTSPAAQAMLAQADQASRSNMLKQQAETSFSANQNDLTRANELMEWASTSNRLANTEYPELFQTSEDRMMSPLQDEATKIQEWMKANQPQSFRGRAINNPDYQAAQQRLSELQNQMKQVGTGNWFGQVQQTTNVGIPGYEQGGTTTMAPGYGQGGAYASQTGYSPNTDYGRQAADYNSRSNVTVRDYLKSKGQNYLDNWLYRNDKTKMTFAELERNDPGYYGKIQKDLGLSGPPSGGSTGQTGYARPPYNYDTAPWNRMRG